MKILILLFCLHIFQSDVGTGQNLTDLSSNLESFQNPDQYNQQQAPEEFNNYQEQPQQNHEEISRPDRYDLEQQQNGNFDTQLPDQFIQDDQLNEHSDDEKQNATDEFLQEPIQTFHNLNGITTPDPLVQEIGDDDIRRSEKVGDQKLDEMLDKFRALKCFKEHENDKIADFCTQSHDNIFLNHLGKLDFTPLMLFKWLENNLYKPLGYKMYTKFTFPDVFSSFLDISKQDSMIHPEMKIPNNKQFQQTVLDQFKNIEDSSTDFLSHKKDISKNILNILKKFHIFWNVHRQRHQMRNLHSNTMGILRNVLINYKHTNDAMKATIINLLSNVKDAYYRFLRADKLKTVMDSRPAELVTVEILRRYKNNIEKIHQGESSSKLMIKEIAYILDLLRAFFIINYKNQITDSKNKNLYEIFIKQKILNIFSEYQQYLLELGDQSYNEFKDFTAALLLKMEMRKFIIFQKYTIEAYVHMPVYSFTNEFGDAIKIYYQFIDSMLIIPSQCDNLNPADLRLCYNEKSSQLISQFYKQYQLHASIQGSDLLSFLESNINFIEKELERKHAYDNLLVFKNEYTQEVAEFSRTFQEKYQIKQMQTIEDLENEIGFQVEKTKAFHMISKISYKMIDEMDRDLYDLFLKIKSKFNKYAPLNKDMKVMMIIAKTVGALLDKFVQRQHEDNQDINLLIKKIKLVINHWLEDHSVQYVVNSHPLNLQHPYTESMEILGTDPLTNHESLNREMISSNTPPGLGLSTAKITAKDYFR